MIKNFVHEVIYILDRIIIVRVGWRMMPCHMGDVRGEHKVGEAVTAYCEPCTHVFPFPVANGSKYLRPRT